LVVPFDNLQFSARIGLRQAFCRFHSSRGRPTFFFFLFVLFRFSFYIVAGYRLLYRFIWSSTYGVYFICFIVYYYISSDFIFVSRGRKRMGGEARFPFSFAAGKQTRDAALWMLTTAVAIFLFSS